MNKSFDAILNALRNNNCMAIDSHNNREVKIEAIAKFGELDTIAMPADVPYYSINGMYVNDNGRAVISQYSWGVMNPDCVRDTPADSAEEYNKPHHHTPGISYHTLSDVTVVEVKVFDHEHLIYQLDLDHVENNPLPQVTGKHNVLCGSADHHLFVSATELPTKDFSLKIVENMMIGVEALKAASDIQIEASTTDTLGIEKKDWYPVVMRNCPNLAVPMFAALKNIFQSESPVNATSFSFVTTDNYYVTITDIESRDVLTEEQAHSILTGAAIQARVDVMKMAEELEKIAANKFQ